MGVVGYPRSGIALNRGISMIEFVELPEDWREQVELEPGSYVIADYDPLDNLVSQNDETINIYRGNLEMLRLKTSLIRVMLAERGILPYELYDRRFKQYLRNDVGVVERDGIMRGSMKVYFYGCD